MLVVNDAFPVFGPVVPTGVGPAKTVPGAAHVPPSMNVTLPSLTGETPLNVVDVKVTLSPKVEGFRLDATVVVVDAGVTVVVAVALLFPIAGSKVVVETVAVFDIDVGAVRETVATMVIVAECPGPGEGARFGTVQVTVVVPEHTTPAEPLAET